MKNSAELVMKAKNGDSSAWTQLYNETYPVAFGVAMQLVKNKDVVDDMLQDSYITAFTKLDTLQETDKFQHWFNRIVANNCKNYLVKKKPELFSEKSTYNDEGEEIAFDVVDDREEIQPDADVYTQEVKNTFYKMLYNLPEEQKMCVLMCWVQELSIAETAEILGVSENTVKSRLHYAKKKMTAEADEMKKKGISIFSITGFALIPFIRGLFAKGSGIVAGPNAATGIIEACKAGGAVAKVATSATQTANAVKTVSTASKVAKGVGLASKGIATKIVAGVVAVAVAVGGTVAVVTSVNSKPEDTNGDGTTINEEIVMNVTASGICGENLTWEYDDSTGLLVISGTGEMYDYIVDYDNDERPWGMYRDNIKTVVINDGATTIGNDAFYWCGSLTSITISDSVETIGNAALWLCSSLTSVTIPDSVKIIGEWAFGRCESLTNLTIPDSVTTIEEYAFSNCESLVSVTIPDSVTTIDDWAFSNCTSLVSITIPKGVTSLANYVFSGCTSLTSITIPDNITTICEGAFSSCKGLTSITIPNSVTSIDNWTFWDCDKLTNVYYSGTEEQWNNISIGPFNNSGLFYATIHYNQ